MSDLDPKDADVARLYEDYPYPNHGVVSTVVARMLRKELHERRRRPHAGGVQLVDVGCGTGEQTCGIARTFPEFAVLGVDRSGASIARARELAMQHSIDVRFEKIDLLGEIEVIGRPDVIVSVGVLGHLPDPVAGLRALASAARSDTLLFGMVYGRFGHAERLRVREALELLGGDIPLSDRLKILEEGGIASNTGLFHHLSTVGNRARFGPDIRPVEAAKRLVRGRSTTYQADYYGHPRDATFTWVEVGDLLARSGWVLTGWPRRSGMPDSPEQVSRGQATELLRQLPLVERASVYERLVAPFLLYFHARLA